MFFRRALSVLPRRLLILGTVSAFASAVSASETISYSYDALGRLVQVARTGNVNSGLSAKYSYDRADNRINVLVASDSACAGVTFKIASNGAVTEGISSVFTVTKSGTSASSCSVSYATSNGTAVLPGDYTSATAVLVFTSSQASKTVSVATIDDTVVETAETFTMALSNPSGGSALGAPSSATATINDNDSSANQAPTPVNDAGSQQTCSDVYYNVLANDTDPEGNYPLALVSVSPTKFSVSGSSIEYIAPGTSGTAVATYTVRDSLGATATGTLTVTVTGTTRTCTLSAAQSGTVTSDTAAPTDGDPDSTPDGSPEQPQ